MEYESPPPRRQHAETQEIERTGASISELSFATDPPASKVPQPAESEQVTTESAVESVAAAMAANQSQVTNPALDPARLLGDLKREMNRLQREIRLTIQAQLGQMAGRTLGTIEANRELVAAIHEMLDSHGLRVRCTQCGQPSILRVSPRTGASAGVFVFDHSVDGRRTFHGGRVVMPEIRLMAKPPRKPRKSK